MNEEIEQLVRSHPGLVIVHLSEPFLEISQEMEEVIAETRQWRADIRVVRVVLSLHREWARNYRVFGSPCTLVFHNGELRARAPGRFGQLRMREILERAGLLDSPPASLSADP